MILPGCFDDTQLFTYLFSEISWFKVSDEGNFKETFFDVGIYCFYRNAKDWDYPSLCEKYILMNDLAVDCGRVCGLNQTVWDEINVTV